MGAQKVQKQRTKRQRGGNRGLKGAKSKDKRKESVKNTVRSRETGSEGR